MAPDAFSLSVLSATLGALSAGLFRTGLEWIDRNRSRQAILKAFASEVAILCWIIRHQYHPDRWRLIANRIEGGEPVRLTLDLSQNFFVTHESLAREIGNLDRAEAALITEFYTICKIAIDTVGVHSVYASVPQNMRFAAGILETALKLGDRIVVLPKGVTPKSLLGEPCDWSSTLVATPAPPLSMSEAGGQFEAQRRLGGIGACGTV